MAAAVKIGVSACLLGENVRYDGWHKHDPNITGILGRMFILISVCPEAECGMPTPREPMRLEGDPAAPRLMTWESRVDMTDRMISFCDRKVKELESAGLCGFVFKKDSPSSGLRNVKVYDVDGNPALSGRGLFADAFVRRFPALPVAEDENLSDPSAMEEFIRQVLEYHRTSLLLPVP